MAATLTKGANASVQPRMRHTGSNFMDASFVTALSQSLSEQYQFFQLPPNCFVLRGQIKGSQKSGVSGQCIFKLGTSKGASNLGTYTVSGGAVLAAQNLSVTGPVTLSSSGGANSASNPQFYPVIATISSAITSATISLSLYVLLEYVMPGLIGDNTGQGL